MSVLSADLIKVIMLHVRGGWTPIHPTFKKKIGGYICFVLGEWLVGTVTRLRRIVDAFLACARGLCLVLTQLHVICLMPASVHDWKIKVFYFMLVSDPLKASVKRYRIDLSSKII